MSLLTLPREIRDEILTNVLNPPANHRKEPFLDPAPQKLSSVGLWIENGNLITNRNWLNWRKTCSPTPDCGCPKSWHPWKDTCAKPPQCTCSKNPNTIAVLQTCRQLYQETSELLFDQTIFYIFDSKKYERPEYHHRSNHQEWFKRPAGPTTLLGTLQTPPLLHKIQHVRIHISARNRQKDLSRLITNLTTILSALNPDRKSTTIDIDFNDPKQRAARPVISPETLSTFMEFIRTTTACISITMYADWWALAFGRKRLLVLEKLCAVGRGRLYPSVGEMSKWRSFVEASTKWKIPWCGECERCQRMLAYHSADLDDP